MGQPLSENNVKTDRELHNQIQTQKHAINHQDYYHNFKIKKQEAHHVPTIISSVVGR